MSNPSRLARLLRVGVFLASASLAAGQPEGKAPPAVAKSPTLAVALQDVQKHYAAIEGSILRAGTMKLAEFREQAQAKQEAAKEPSEKVALSYLIARSWYWQAQKEVKDLRSREVFDKYRSDLFRSHLDAFDLAQHTVKENKDDTIAAGLRTRLVEGMAQLLGTNMWAGALSKEDKAALSQRFLDVVEQEPALSDVLQKRGNVRQIYANLGVESRLDKRIPDPLPAEYDALVRLLEENLSVCSPAALKCVADAIEANHAEKVKADGKGTAVLARLWESNNDMAKAATYLKLSAAQSPDQALQVYLLSFRPEAKLTADERADFLNKYLSAKPDAKDAAYDHVTRALLANGLGQEGLRVIELYDVVVSY